MVKQFVLLMEIAQRIYPFASPLQIGKRRCNLCFSEHASEGDETATAFALRKRADDAEGETPFWTR